MVVGLAVVGRKPTASARCQQGTVGPAIGVNGMNENDVALVDGHGDGGFIGRRGNGGGRMEMIEGAQVVVEKWL